MYYKPIISVLLLASLDVLAKLQIDVSIPLAENVCQVTKNFIQSQSMQPELKKAVLEVPEDPSGVCYIWRWIRCEFTHKEPCGTWNKTLCPGKGGDGDRKNGHCDIYQCGWTIDEMYLNWGYNPEHVRPLNPLTPPLMDIIDTGSTLDFPKSESINEVK